MLYLSTMLLSMTFLLISIEAPRKLLRKAEKITQDIRTHKAMHLCGRWLAAKANLDVAMTVSKDLPRQPESVRRSCQSEKLKYGIRLVQQKNPELPDLWPNHISRVILKGDVQHAN